MESLPHQHPIQRKNSKNAVAFCGSFFYLSMVFNINLRKQRLNIRRFYSIMGHMNSEVQTKNHTNELNRIERGFELLAPAGSFEIFKAVIAAGADAVYVGGDMFGARAYANNFSAEELLEAIDYAHLHGVKVYLTVNTLLKNAELTRRLYDYLLPFYKQGLDAVLVQDMGVFSFIRECFPGLPIHTSTQMTVTGVEGARLMQRLGAERVVMAREVSLPEMKRIYEETGVELEAFVHGALCYCYSGQCLLSSMLGGRSGNRGRCAQPCRLAYSVLDENHKIYEKDSYVLSLKDMCGIEDLKKLWDAGVYSLKIEGRMKQAPYAAGVVSYYRKYIDRFLENQKQEKVTKSDMQDILDLGNRCGFTDGYYSKQNGPDMVTFVKPSYAKTNEALQKGIVDRFVGHEDKITANGSLTLHLGQPAVYELTSSVYTVQATGNEVMAAQKKPLNADDLKTRMAKTGDTPFVMNAIDIVMDENVFLPVGALNQLRREATEQLLNAMLSSYRRNENLQDYKPAADREEKCDHADQGAALVQTAEIPAASVSRQSPRYSCLIETRVLLSEILNRNWISRVYLDFGAYRWNHFPQELSEDIKAIRESGKEAYFALPRIFRMKASDLFTHYKVEFQALSLDGVLVRNYEELSSVEFYFGETNIVIDHNLYTYNDCASGFFDTMKISENTVPLELNRKEILHRDNTKSAMVVYGYYPLMTTAPCVHANTRGCDKKPGLCFLKDRYKVEFPVRNYCDACYNVVYNSLPVMLFAHMRELKESGMLEFRADFTMETRNEAQKVLDLMEAFAAGKQSEYPIEWKDRYTNGHYKRGVE